MREHALLVLCAATWLLVACDTGADSEGQEGADVVSHLPDATVLMDGAADSREGCAVACDEDLCQTCQDGACVSVCKAEEVCMNGICVVPGCDPGCGACQSCEDGACVDDCTGDESCHEGVCEVPPTGCEPACGECEDCDTTDQWAPTCVGLCTGEELCHEGACEVPPDCPPEDCPSDECMVCDSTDIWNPICVGTCDTDNCQGCDGAGSCVGQCVAADCEVCDGAGTCETTCDAAACEACDGQGGCGVTCDPDACEACDGARSCVVTCAADEYCDAGQCLTRPDVTCEEEDGFCAGAVASVLELVPSPEAASADACCCDLTGDGVPDNKLGEVIEMLEPFLGVDREYFNEELAWMIENGALIFLFEFLGVDDVSQDAFLQFNVYEGVDTDDWVYNNLLGGAEFYVSRDSIDRDGNPVTPFEAAHIDGGTLYGGPARFVLPLDLVGDEPVMLLMEGTSITADISSAAIGYDLHEGTVCGHIERSKIINEINTFAAQNCGCLNLAGELLVDSGSAISCSAASATSTCDPWDQIEDFCQQFFDNCGMVALVAPALFDVDTDGDGDADAMSVSLIFEAVSASLVGLEPEAR